MYGQSERRMQSLDIYTIIINLHKISEFVAFCVIVSFILSRFSRCYCPIFKWQSSKCDRLTALAVVSLFHLAIKIIAVRLLVAFSAVNLNSIEKLHFLSLLVFFFSASAPFKYQRLEFKWLKTVCHLFIRQLQLLLTANQMTIKNATADVDLFHKFQSEIEKQWHIIVDAKVLQSAHFV